MDEKPKRSNPRMQHVDGMYAPDARKEDHVTLLDDFAGKAMQGLLSTGNVNFINPHGSVNANRLAALSYDIAEAMLKQRDR